jgi:CRISPR-associated protein Cmr5
MPGTREQERARFALGKVEGLTTHREKYKTQLLKLPARLHQNGLGPTVAFYLAAGPGKPEWQICTWLEEWLRQTGAAPPNQRLIDAITQGDAASYRRASAEARALAVWLKRFAEAFLAEDAA